MFRSFLLHPWGRFHRLILSLRLNPLVHLFPLRPWHLCILSGRQFRLSLFVPWVRCCLQFPLIRSGLSGRFLPLHRLNRLRLLHLSGRFHLLHRLFRLHLLHRFHLSVQNPLLHLWIRYDHPIQ